MFLRQARQSPDSLAVRDVDQRLIYAELRDRSVRLAGRLVAAGVRPADPVLVCTDRTIHSVVAGLAVAAAGATIVPVEAGGPVRRFALIRERSGATVAAVAAFGAAGIDELRCVEVDRVRADDIEGPVRAATEVAALLFTSGSTGEPKGVQVTQRNLVSLLGTADQWDGLTRHDLWAATCSFTFDVSMMELWRPLTCGAQVLVMPREAQLDTSLARSLVEEHGVTTMFQTPTAIRSRPRPWRGPGRLPPCAGSWSAASAWTSPCSPRSPRPSRPVASGCGTPTVRPRRRSSPRRTA